MTNNFLKGIFLLNILFLSSTNCNLTLPLKFIPVYKVNDTSPSSIMRNIVYTKAYAEIEIGTPKQLIQIPLSFNSNDFYISDNAKYEFSTNPELYSNLKFFNSDNSETCEKIEEFTYNGDNFDYGQYYKDFFYFNDTKVEMEFYLPIVLKTPESGGIGLQLWPRKEETTSTTNDKKTFLKKLKNQQLIKEYYWSVFYNSKDYKNKEGFLLLGTLPQFLNKDLGYYKKEYFDSQYLRSISADIWVDYIEHKFEFDEVYAFEGKNKEKKILDITFPENITRLKKVELYYNFGGIQAPYRFLDYFVKYFEEYTSRGECFYDYFTLQKKKYFFYCKNDQNLISKIKQNFPGFNFKSHELDYNYDLVGDDLFVEENNFVYLLMFFPDKSEDSWIMGRPFLQKYQFFINPEKKNINFYSNEGKINAGSEEKQENNTKSNIALYIVIIVSVIIILILGFFLWKYYFEAKSLKKKRANELDDDYDYQQKEDLTKKESINPINE